jgi:hypothetical protein
MAIYEFGDELCTVLLTFIEFILTLVGEWDLEIC